MGNETRKGALKRQLKSLLADRTIQERAIERSLTDDVRKHNKRIAELETKIEKGED
jgi:uncharacterized protein YbaP (TraB family)